MSKKKGKQKTRVQARKKIRAAERGSDVPGRDQLMGDAAKRGWRAGRIIARDSMITKES
jgi:hypothetical protein